MTYILETGRLQLRALNYGDANFIVQLMNSPGWLAFIGDRNVRSEEAAKSYLKNGPLKSYRENGFGLYLVETKESPKSIGMCGILKRETLDHPDIGFAFLPEYSGQGYAREIAKATVAWAGNSLNIPKLLAITKPDNHRSIALLEHIGLKFQRKFESPADNTELLLYGIDFHLNDDAKTS